MSSARKHDNESTYFVSASYLVVRNESLNKERVAHGVDCGYNDVVEGSTRGNAPIRRNLNEREMKRKTTK